MNQLKAFFLEFKRSQRSISLFFFVFVENFSTRNSKYNAIHFVHQFRMIYVQKVLLVTDSRLVPVIPQDIFVYFLMKLFEFYNPFRLVTFMFCLEKRFMIMYWLPGIRNNKFLWEYFSSIFQTKHFQLQFSCVWVYLLVIYFVKLKNILRVYELEILSFYFSNNSFLSFFFIKFQFFLALSIFIQCLHILRAMHFRRKYFCFQMNFSFNFFNLSCEANRT